MSREHCTRKDLEVWQMLGEGEGKTEEDETAGRKDKSRNSVRNSNQKSKTRIYCWHVGKEKKTNTIKFRPSVVWFVLHNIHTDVEF